MRLAAFALAFHALFTGAAAAGPPIEIAPADGRFTLREPARELPAVLGGNDGIVMTSLTREGRALARDFLLGDGGGADVSNLSLTQVHYVDSACAFPLNCGGPCNNVIQALWVETTANPEGVDIILNGTRLGTVQGLPPNQLPDVNGVFLSQVPAGNHTVRAQAVNQASVVEDSILVINNQPFDDPGNLQCRQGAVDGGGTCEFVATWENADPPAVYGLFFDNVFQGTIPGSTTDVTFFQVAAGRHCVTIVGSESTMAGQYLGCALESCCDLACLPTEACNPPSALLACQLAYGPAAADNAVLLGWLNGKSRYARGLNLYRDGALELFVPTDPLEGNPSQYLFGGLAPGEHAFGVQGDCGAPDGLSSIAAASLEVLTQTPHTSPIEGQPSCTWSAANGGTTTVTWTNDDPSAFIQVYVEVGMTLFAVGLIPGSRTGVDVFGTLATDPIVLQFFVSQGGRCYGSEFVRCVPGTGARSRFIRGLCDGTGELPTISSAIYLFNFLFLGGNPPPCRVACDANGDGEVNISDGSYVLNFLFLGASAPPGWVDSDADGRRDPTCVEAAAGEDCAASHAACGG